MKIYTKTGDKGQTSLFTRERVSKDDLRVEAYGTIDELNSYLGVCRAYVSDEHSEELLNIQRDLFVVGGHLASRDNKYPNAVTDQMITHLENGIDQMKDTKEFNLVKGFIIPGSSIASAHLNVARTVCRRAERRAITVALSEEVNENVMKYINRLSDYLFAMGTMYETNPNNYERPKKNNK